MEQHTDDAWERLAQAVRLRIDRKLKLRDKDVAARAGFSPETLSKILNARATAYSKHTLGRLADVLNWPSSVIPGVLAGDIEPIQAADAFEYSGTIVVPNLADDDEDDRDGPVTDPTMSALRVRLDHLEEIVGSMARSIRAIENELARILDASSDLVTRDELEDRLDERR